MEYILDEQKNFRYHNKNLENLSNRIKGRKKYRIISKNG